MYPHRARFGCVTIVISRRFPPRTVPTEPPVDLRVRGPPELSAAHVLLVRTASPADWPIETGSVYHDAGMWYNLAAAAFVVQA